MGEKKEEFEVKKYCLLYAVFCVFVFASVEIYAFISPCFLIRYDTLPLTLYQGVFSLLFSVLLFYRVYLFGKLTVTRSLLCVESALFFCSVALLILYFVLYAKFSRHFFYLCCQTLFTLAATISQYRRRIK